MTELKTTYGKYENYIRVGEVGGTLYDLPTPSSVSYSFKDVDKDPFTDLQGYTQRNRVRHDVLQITFVWDTLGEDDIQYILNKVGSQWIDLECLDKHTKQKHRYKVYASDKDFDTWRAWKDNNNQWHDVLTALTITFTEQ